jgi:hypothetical protein
MAESVRVWLKKIFSLTLILNSFVTLAAVIGLTYGFYMSFQSVPWKPFAPYLISGNIFLLVIVAALINIFPSASIGRKLHTGRFLFHHYVYGAFVLVASSFCVIAFSPISLVNLFLVNTPNISLNTKRFFVLTGITLFLDDLPDVSKRIEMTLNKIKTGFYKIRKAMHVLQFVTGATTFYVFLSILLTEIHGWHVGVSNALTMGTMLVTSITSFAFVKRKAWLNITPGATTPSH